MRTRSHRFKVGDVQCRRCWLLEKHTARTANKLFKREARFLGRRLFDVFMRDQEHERQTIRYIERTRRGKM